MMVNSNKILISLACAGMLAGCVTQRYDGENNNPVIQNESSKNDIAMTRISLGLEYLRMGNTTQAKLNLEKAKRFAPNLVQVHTAFAHYYDKVAEPELAIKAYEKALSIKPDDADTLNNYGAFLCKHNQFDKSEKQFLKAINTPSYLLVSQSYQNLSICQLKAKHFDKAENYLEKAIVHNPNDADVLLLMLQVQYIKGNYKGAKEYLQRYEKATRRFTPEALGLAFKVYDRLFDRQTAKNYASMLVKMFPDSYQARQYLLNGLTDTDADKLAKEYQLTQIKPYEKKKRVVVLSPDKPLSSKPEKTLVASDAKANEAQTDVVATEGSPTDTSESEQAKVQVSQTEASAIEQVQESSVTAISEPQSEVENTDEAPLKTELLAVSPEIEQQELELAKQRKAELEKQKAEQLQDDSDVSSAVASALQVEQVSPSKKTEDGQQLMTIPVHVVKKGESLFAISKKYNIHMKAIERWNNFSRNQVLRLGQVLYLANPDKAAKSQEN
ncbi:type IV pilus biogenesis/stability protein PilW [Thalassotalea ganghwensis]